MDFDCVHSCHHCVRAYQLEQGDFDQAYAYLSTSLAAFRTAYSLEASSESLEGACGWLWGTGVHGDGGLEGRDQGREVGLTV